MTESSSIQDLIRRAREGIVGAVKERLQLGEEPLLRVKTVTVELNVVATSGKEASGGLNFWIITIGGKKSYQQEQVHKLIVELDALTPVEMQRGTFRSDPLSVEVDKG